MAEEDAQRLGDGEDELAMREVEEELLVEVVGEKEGSFLGAGRAEVEAPTVKGTEVLETASGAPAAQARLPPEGFVHWMRAMPWE